MTALPPGVLLVTDESRPVSAASPAYVMVEGRNVGYVMPRPNDTWSAGFDGRGVHSALYGHPTPEAAAVALLDLLAAEEAEQARLRAEAADRKARGIIHVRRTPLPWHGDDDTRSWCNRPRGARWADSIDEVPVEDRHLVCKVCGDQVKVFGRLRWEDNPVQMLGLWTPWDSRHRVRLNAQLLALAQLAGEYPDRFRDLADAELAMAYLVQPPPKPKKRPR